MATANAETRARAVVDFGPFGQIPVGALVVLLLLALLSFTAGFLFPEVMANCGLAF